MTADENVHSGAMTSGENAQPVANIPNDPQGQGQFPKPPVGLTSNSPEVEGRVEQIMQMGLPCTREEARKTILKHTFGNNITVAMDRAIDDLLKTPSLPEITPLFKTENQNGQSQESPFKKPFVEPVFGPAPAPKKSQQPAKQPPGDVRVINETDSDLSKAIENSMQDDVDIQKALAASLSDQDQKRSSSRREGWVLEDPIKNPHHRVKQGNTPVGLRNVGSVCWLNSVVQTLFHMTEFREMIFKFDVPKCRDKLASRETVEAEDQSSFSIDLIETLRKVFARLMKSERKYTNSFLVVNLIRKHQTSFKISDSDNMYDQQQQDVSEFLHVLLDWLEMAFQIQNSVTENADAAASATTAPINPILSLFYGKFFPLTVGDAAHERFSLWSVPACHSNLHDAVEASLSQPTTKWMERLPPFFMFAMNRFAYNSATNEVEKVNTSMKFPNCLYLDRYLYQNRDLTIQKRDHVAQLREKLHSVKERLKGYLEYGNSEFRGPLSSMMSCVIDYTSKGGLLLNDSNDVAMDSPASSNSAPEVVGDTAMEVDGAAGGVASVAGALRVEVGDGPMSPQDGASHKKMVVDYLARMLTELKAVIQNLEKEVKALETEVELAYDVAALKSHQYKLHAVLVHEGQAVGGHYWTLIQDGASGIWKKFNDTEVLDCDWDRVCLESFGEMVANTSAYCLVYAQQDQQTTTECNVEYKLPEDLYQEVQEDNEKLQLELFEYDRAQSCSLESVNGTLEPGLLGYPFDLEDVKPDMTQIYMHGMDYVMGIVLDVVNDWGPTKPWSPPMALKMIENRLRIDLWEKMRPVVDFEMLRTDDIGFEMDYRPTCILAWLLCTCNKIDFESNESSWKLHLMASLTACGQRFINRVQLKNTAILERLNEVLHLNEFNQRNVKKETVDKQMEIDHKLYHLFRCNIVLMDFAAQAFRQEDFKQMLMLCQVGIENNEQILLGNSMGLAQCGYLRVLWNVFRLALLKYTEQKSQELILAPEAKAAEFSKSLKSVHWDKICYLISKRTSPIDKQVINKVQHTWCAIISQELSESINRILNDEVLHYVLDQAARPNLDEGSRCKANIKVINVQQDIKKLLTACKELKWTSEQCFLQYVGANVDT